MRRASLVGLALCVAGAITGWSAELHVSAAHGADTNDGSAARPFRTISAAARLAMPGDTVTVHAGVYRERVTPPRGGDSAARPIIYQAAPGEVAEIRGSEQVRGWKPFRGSVWKLTLPDSFFGAYNPYRDLIAGDWFTDRGRPHHTGEVYINGRSLLEAHQLDGVIDPKPYPEARDQEAARWTWYTASEGAETHIYANFHGLDPNRETVEINVRDSCFYPDRPGRDFITVRGFRLRHAATQWAAPTAEQIGLIGTHWSKGWVIENNEISDSKCSCVTLGKDRATGQNVWSANRLKDGATHYNEVILRALEAGWSRERIGGHAVRNNVIHGCEQAGIAGSLGAVYSEITGNHIYNVWAKRQFTGAEMGGIKLHGAIDVLIHGNRIHNTGRGLWMDWMAQGTRISSNLLYDNTTDDLFVEVNHGPFLADNNIFLSPVTLRDWSEDGAYVNNWMGGEIISRPEPNRWTPYHRPHLTALAGVTLTIGGGNRFYNNIFVGQQAPPANARPDNQSIAGYGLWVYDTRQFASQAAGNVYVNGARPYQKEADPLVIPGGAASARVVEQGNDVVLELKLSEAIRNAPGVRVTTALLGHTRVAEAAYENPDGTPVTLDTGYFGHSRSSAKPGVGPFADVASGDVKLTVWRAWLGQGHNQ